MHININITANSGYLVFLQRAKHLRLGTKAHIAYFIEEKRSPISQFKFPYPLPICTAKGSLLMAEKLTFYEFRWDRRAVDFQERTVRTPAKGMYPMRHQLLTRAVLTSNQNPGRRGGHSLYYPTNLAQRLRFSHHPVRLLHLLTKNLRFSHQAQPI